MMQDICSPGGVRGLRSCYAMLHCARASSLRAQSSTSVLFCKGCWGKEQSLAGVGEPSAYRHPVAILT